MEYECVICLTKDRDVNKYKCLCPMSSKHIMCMDCYIHMAYNAIQKDEDLCCPYCRTLIQKVSNIDLSNDDIKRILPKNESLRNGKKHGLCEIFFLGGEIMERTHYSNGKRHGKSIQYFPDGKVHIEFNYHNGKLQGETKIYFPDGKIQVQCNYRKDELHGIYKEWNEDGNIIILHTYKNGKKNGRCYDYTYQWVNDYSFIYVSGGIQYQYEPVLQKIITEMFYDDDGVGVVVNSR